MDATTENITAALRARLDPAQADGVMLKIGPVLHGARFAAIGRAGWWVEELVPLAASPVEIARIAHDLIAALSVRPENDGTSPAARRPGASVAPAQAARSAAQEQQP